MTAPGEAEACLRRMYLGGVNMSGDVSGESGPAAVLYDGVCNLCSATVRFIVKRDPAARFRFAPLQSDIARERLRNTGLPAGGPAFIVLVEDGRAYVKSEAVLRIAQRLRAPWPALAVFRLVPRVLRDACYDAVASRRYRWFGRKAACEMPAEDIKARFL